MTKDFHFSKGNLKIGKETLIWNLPASTTCPGSSTRCRHFCYALKAERVYTNALLSRRKNLLFSKSEHFVQEIVTYLRKQKETTIRLHESGDFYNYQYWKKWCDIARQLPEKTFLAYTKSYFLNNFWKDIPSNLKIVQSVESRFPNTVDWNRATARVIENTSERRTGEFICPEQLAKKRGIKIRCMRECKLCLRENIHVCFIKH